ncbi:MAG: hypothetical protein Ta2A_11890 [Treponemataceae bacterium]|nr:MAG: hypothetical protein Ta2A_11890 [Treponemataceae bacterium]
MKYIAVQGCQLQFDGIQPMTLSTAQVSTPPSAKVTCGGNGAYKGAITIAAVFTTTGAPPTLPLSFTINGTAIKTKIENQAAVLEGDQSAVVPWSYAVGTATVSGAAMCKIQSAGQQKVQGN